MCVFCFPLGGLARLAVPEADAVDLPLQVSGSRDSVFGLIGGLEGGMGFGGLPLYSLYRAGQKGPTPLYPQERNASLGYTAEGFQSKKRQETETPSTPLFGVVGKAFFSY